MRWYHSPPYVDRTLGPLKGVYRGYRDNGKENGNYYLGFRV